MQMGRRDDWGGKRGWRLARWPAETAAERQRRVRLHEEKLRMNEERRGTGPLRGETLRSRLGNLGGGREG
jgi:hypothetical protein